MTGKDNLSFLLENGMPLEDIKKCQADGLSLDEVAAAVERLLKDGGKLATEDIQEADKPKGKPFLTEEVLYKYLETQGMVVQLNVITHDIEISGIPDSYNPETARSDFPVILHDALKLKYR